MKLIRLPLIILTAATSIQAFTTIPSSRTTNTLRLSKQDIITTEPSSIPKTQSKRQRLQKLGIQVWDRMDTFKSAGLTTAMDADNKDVIPMQAGFKTNVGLLVGAFLFKWYRARFVTKIPVWDRQPQWNMVVTSPEHEKELHAYQCKTCGSTIFIARHREWFFKGGNTECTNCGAKGKDNFIDIREDVIEEIDDDYFDYPSPLDYVSAAERRRLVKEAGGDEELAKKIAIEKALKDDPKQIQVEKKDVAADGEDGEKKKSKKKKKSSETKEEEGALKNNVEAEKKDDDVPKAESVKTETPKTETLKPKAEAVKEPVAPKADAPKKVPKLESDDILDELDMDF